MARHRQLAARVTPAGRSTVINAVADTIQPAIWSHRKHYAWVVTVALLAGWAFSDKLNLSERLLAWLLSFMVTLVMLGPTAEQFGKWLAQVAAIRNGTRPTEVAPPPAATGRVDPDA